MSLIARIVLEILVEFLTELGDLPLLIPNTTYLALVNSTGYSLINPSLLLNVTEYRKGVDSSFDFTIFV
jgi:hypothetical protein